MEKFHQYSGLKIGKISLGCFFRAVGRSENLGGQVLIQGLLNEQVLILFWPKSGLGASNNRADFAIVLVVGGCVCVWGGGNCPPCPSRARWPCYSVWQFQAYCNDTAVRIEELQSFADFLSPPSNGAKVVWSRILGFINIWQIKKTNKISKENYGVIHIWVIIFSRTFCNPYPIWFYLLPLNIPYQARLVYLDLQ